MARKTAAFSKYIHAVIVVLRATDHRLLHGIYRGELQKIRDYFRTHGNNDINHDNYFFQDCDWFLIGQFKTPIIFKVVFKDVRAHCYYVSLVRTLYMTWHVPRHVFQARAPSRNSIKYRAGDLCGDLICEYFCWIIGDPHFFFGRSLSFLILSIILKNKKYLCVGSFNYFLYTIQIGSNWYMDTGVRDLEVAYF